MIIFQCRAHYNHPHIYHTATNTHKHTMACCVRSQTFELVYIRIWTCYYFFLLHLLCASSLCWTGFALVQNLIVYNVHIAVSNDVSLFIYIFSLSLSFSICLWSRKKNDFEFQHQSDLLSPTKGYTTKWTQKPCAQSNRMFSIKIIIEKKYI